MTRFVPNGSALAATPDQPLTRRDLAVVLVGSAEEYDFDQRSIRTTPNGFYVSDEQYKLLFEDGVETEAGPGAEAEPAPGAEAEPAPEKPAPKRRARSTKTSGSRAAKNSNTTASEKE